MGIFKWYKKADEIDGLIKILTDKNADPLEKVSAITILLQKGGSRAIDFLLADLHDDHSSVRDLALSALIEMCDKLSSTNQAAMETLSGLVGNELRKIYGQEKALDIFREFRNKYKY